MNSEKTEREKKLQELQAEYRRIRSYACSQADYGNWAPTARLNEISAKIEALEAELEKEEES